MFPLEEQDNQEQSAHPSLKQISNDDDEDDDGRVTPHYKECEEEEEKSIEHYDIPYENSHTYDDFCQQNNCTEDYQKMRQNPHINYESFFKRKFTFGSNQNSQHDQMRQTIKINSVFRPQEYDFSPVNQSFQNLMDSNFNRNESVQEKKFETNTIQSVCVQTKNTEPNLTFYPEVTINGEPLTNNMLLDPEIRWRLMLELFTLQKTEISTGSSVFSDLFQKFQAKYIEQKQEFQQVQKVLEQKGNHIQQLIEESLEKQVEKRQQKEFLVLYKYEETKSQVFEKFRENAQKSINALEESIGKRFQKKSLQLMRTRRAIMHSVQEQIKEHTQQTENIQIQLKSLEKSQNQSLQKVETEIGEKFMKLQEDIISARKEIKIKECMIEESLEKLSGRVTGYLNKEIAEGKEIEQQLTKLLMGLIDKLE